MLSGQLSDKKELESLYAIARKYKDLYENSPDLLRSVDLNGILTDCNKSYAIHLGYTKEELVGRSIFEHTAERSLKEMTEEFSKWKQTLQEVQNHEIWLKRKDGTIFPALFGSTNLFDTNNNVIGRTVSMKDMTEIYNAKQELEIHKIKRFMIIGQLSARLAHDLRNPLSIIKNAVDLIKIKNPDLDKNIANDIAKIERASSRMIHQIEDVLDYVRPISTNIEKSSTLSIMKGSIERILVPEKIKIELSERDIVIYGDAEKLEIVLANLILNSIQAMNNSGIIRVIAKEKGSYTELEIEDSGNGIPKEVLPKIFDPLFTTKQTGTGLGLSSCKNIIEGHGGTIEVKNTSQKGTTFLIKIPNMK